MSNKKKHTQGPWKVFTSKDTGIIEVSPSGKKSSPIIQWQGFDGNDRSYAENLANANLIAAAPDMLKALKEARISIEGWGSFASDHFKEKYDLAGELAMLDSIIAMAENGNTFAVPKD